MPLLHDVRMVKPRAATPFGGLDQLWKALLRGESALRYVPNLSPEFPVATTWFNKNPQQVLLDTGWIDGVTRTEVFPSPQKLNLFASTKGPSGHIRPLWSKPQADFDTGLRRCISNACSSGSTAVIEGMDAVADGDFETVCVSATDFLSEFIVRGFASLEALSLDPAKPFDRSRTGLSLGEAGAAVWLRIANGSDELSQYPRVIAYGCSNDANHISGPSRDGSGLALAMERALRGIDKSEIRAICAHGTATIYNDAMEARAFHTVFDGNPPPVFGIKGAIGHTLGAAGLIEVIVSARVATEGIIPPTVGFEEGEVEFPLDVVHGEPRQIEPGYVLTTNSGFGGMNTAIVIGPGSDS